MRRPRHLDFKCPSCSYAGTHLVETNDDDTPLESELCPKLKVGESTTCCMPLTQVDTVFNGYMKTIVKGSHDFNERERERLEKRQDDHWQREGKHEAIEAERALFKKHDMEGVGGLK